MREVLWEKFVNEGDLDIPPGRHCYEGDWSKMRELTPQMGERWQLWNSQIYDHYLLLSNVHMFRQAVESNEYFTC